LLGGLVNSLIVAISVTLISLVLGSFAGFAIGKLRFKGKTASMYVIFGHDDVSPKLLCWRVYMLLLLNLGYRLYRG